MVDMVQRSVGALFHDDERAGDAIGNLVRSGVLPGSLTIVAQSAHRARTFSESFYVEPVSMTDHTRGGLGELLSGRPSREHAAEESLRDELSRRGLDDDRAAHFSSALGEGVLLILAGRDVTPERVGMLIAARADLGLANMGGVERVIPLRAELLDVQKAVVVTNEVTVKTEVISEIQSFDVEVTREEFVIVRTPRGPSKEVETIRIPIRHEEVVITKQTIVTEEVSVHTEQTLNVEHIEETVKHEVLRVVDQATQGDR